MDVQRRLMDVVPTESCCKHLLELEQERTLEGSHTVFQYKLIICFCFWTNPTTRNLKRMTLYPSGIIYQNFHTAATLHSRHSTLHSSHQPRLFHQLGSLTHYHLHNSSLGLAHRQSYVYVRETHMYIWDASNRYLYTRRFLRCGIISGPTIHD